MFDFNGSPILVGGNIVPGGILDQDPSYLGGRLSLGGAGAIAGLDQRQSLLRLEARDKSKSQTYVLSLDYKVREPAIVGQPAAVANHLPRAQLQWGSIKGKGEALVDIRHGTRITLEGTSLGVNAFMAFATDQGLNPAGGPTRIDVYGSVAAGSVGKSPSLTFTEDSRAVNAGATTDYNIPSYAREVEVQQAGDPFAAPANNFSLDFYSTVPGAAARLISRSTGVDNNRITIPNGAEVLRINNITANLIFTPVFHLAL